MNNDLVKRFSSQQSGIDFPNKRQKNEKIETTSIFDISDIAYEVFSHFSFDDLFACSYVSKSFQQVSQKAAFWNKLCIKCNIKNGEFPPYQNFIFAIASKNLSALVEQASISYKLGNIKQFRSILLQANFKKASVDQVPDHLESKYNLLHLYLEQINEHTLSHLDYALSEKTKKYKPVHLASAQFFLGKMYMQINLQNRAAVSFSNAKNHEEVSFKTKIKVNCCLAIQRIRFKNNPLTHNECFNYFEEFYKSPIRLNEKKDAIIGMIRLVSSRRTTLMSGDQAFDLAEQYLKHPLFTKTKKNIPESLLLYSYSASEWLESLQFTLYKKKLINETNKKIALVRYETRYKPNLDIENAFLDIYTPHNQVYINQYLEILSNNLPKDIRHLLAACILKEQKNIYYISNSKALSYIEKIIENKEDLSSEDSILALDVFNLLEN